MADFKAITPDASVFASQDQGYLTALAADLNNPMRRLELIRRMEGQGGGQQAYLQALSEAQRTQLAGAERDGQRGLATAYLNNIANIANAGISNAVQLPDNPYLRVNQDQLQMSDVINMNEGLSSNFKTTTEGLANLSTVGYLPNAETVGKMITGPFETEAMAVQPYMSPQATSQRITAEAARTNSQANMIDAKNPAKYRSNSNNDDKVVTTYIGGEPISTTVTTKGRGAPAQAAPNVGPAPSLNGATLGIDPTTGQVVVIPAKK